MLTRNKYSQFFIVFNQAPFSDGSMTPQSVAKPTKPTTNTSHTTMNEGSVAGMNGNMSTRTSFSIAKMAAVSTNGVHNWQLR